VLLQRAFAAKSRFLARGPIRRAGVGVVLASLIVFLAAPSADAQVGVVLNESLNESMDRITGTGHTAVYFAHICPESPVKLRMCGPDESGSVISNYINIGEDQSFEWNVVPLNIYLYGVEDPRNRPIFGTYKLKRLLEERYREKYLPEYCAGKSCQTSGKAEWREMVAATLIRGVYIFVADTTEEQDRKIIAEFNASANENHFNGVTRNCADFTRHIINTYFPHAVNPDYLNDFGMTSPKAVARAFTRYGLRHPESNFRVLHFPQVPGTIKRSSEVRAGTEQLYRSKKLLVPMAVFAYYALPVVTGSYLLTGRFNPESAFEEHPAAAPGQRNPAAQGNPPAAATAAERVEMLGMSEEWREYGHVLDSIVEENKGAVNGRDLSRFFKYLDKAGTPSLDPDGSAWIALTENSKILRVGVSAGNALAQDSDPQLAFKLALTRTGRILKSPKHRRETMLEFKQDWERLQRASAAMNAIAAGDATDVAYPNPVRGPRRSSSGLAVSSE
jgi:hypothetical protein